MATYIKNDSLDGLNQSLQFIAQQNQRRKAQDLETAIALNRMGKNKEAEELILSSQRGIIGNLLGSDAEEWKAEGIFETPADRELRKIQDLKKKEELYGGVDATQGGILAKLEKEYGGKTKDYYTQLEAMGLQANGADAQSALSTAINTKTVIDPVFNAQRKAYNILQKDQAVVDKEVDKYNAPIIKANKEAEVYNRKAEAYNINKPKYRSSYEGDEVDQNQQLMEDTILAMEYAKSDTEKLKAYNKYVTTGKAISDHYGHKFDAQNPAFFGIGNNKSNGRSAKNDNYSIVLKDGTELNYQLPVGVNPDSKTGRKMISQLLQIPEDSFAHGSSRKDNGDSTYLNDAEKVKMDNDKLVNAKVKSDLIESEIDKRDGVFTSRATAEKEYLDELALDGKTVATDQYGYKRIVPLTNSASQSKDVQQQPTVDYSNIYLKKQ